MSPECEVSWICWLPSLPSESQAITCPSDESTRFRHTCESCASLATTVCTIHICLTIFDNDMNPSPNVLNYLFYLYWKSSKVFILNLFWFFFSWFFLYFRWRVSTKVQPHHLWAWILKVHFFSVFIPKWNKLYSSVLENSLDQEMLLAFVVGVGDINKK